MGEEEAFVREDKIDVKIFTGLGPMDDYGFRTRYYYGAADVNGQHVRTSLHFTDDLMKDFEEVTNELYKKVGVLHMLKNPKVATALADELLNDIIDLITIIRAIENRKS
jgi:hypothetical protein